MVGVKQEYLSSGAEELQLAAWHSGGGIMDLESLFAETRYACAGQAALCRRTVGPHRIAHRAGFGEAVHGETLNLLFVLDGNVRVRQAGREYELGRDQWTLCDTARSYSISADRPVTQLLMTVPKDMLGFHQRDMVRFGSRALPAGTGPGKLVRQAVGSLFDELQNLKPCTATELVSPILDLAHMAVQDSVREDAVSSVREMLHEKMSGFIRRNLRDPDLSVHSIAAAFSCSKRYVHKIFNGERQTVGELILHSRLEQCRRDLADGTRASQSITGIAFGWGFNNSAHFSRVFRERYGLSPSAYRARHARTMPQHAG